MEQPDTKVELRCVTMVNGQGWGKQNIFGQAHYLGEHTERSNRTLCKAHSAKCEAFRLLGGSGGMPHQKIFENITF